MEYFTQLSSVPETFYRNFCALKGPNNDLLYILVYVIYLTFVLKTKLNAWVYSKHLPFNILNYLYFRVSLK